jgi:hypothetical protein
MATEAAANEQAMRRVGAVLIGSGMLLICAGVIVGFFVAPVGFLGVAIGVIDLVVARQFVEGRRGTPNPYARED